MKHPVKRSLALLMAFVMCISLLAGLTFPAAAAEVEYVYDGKYIYNWGTRGTTATFLSPNAEDFYEENQVTYDELAKLSGSSNTSSTPSSDLYKELQELMESNHDHVTNYNETRDLYQYTDCQNSGKTSKKISSFYSGKDIGPAWDSGSTWNREHTWPNSKGLGGSDENDIMMLRPTATSENGSRGNKAYGKSSGYYNPNSASNNTYDVRGDVARIFLYVYVRWGNVNGNGEYSTWGSNGVMESKEVLLEWMEADPVDTWELGRNDSVEAITGTRNVFVDYPELAFVLFDEEVPADMDTPSGEAANGDSDCDHSYSTAVTDPSCTAEGYTTHTCSICGHSRKTDKVPATGHSYVDGACSVCGEAKPAEQLVTIYYPAGDIYVTSTASGSKLAPSANAPTVWTVTEDDNGYVSFMSGGKYMTSGATGNSLSMSDTLTDYGLWEIVEAGGGVYLRNVGAVYNSNQQYVEYYNSVFTTYGFNSSNAAIFTFQLLPLTACDLNGHSWADATVTDPKTCTVCGATEGEALGENRNVSFVVPEGVTAPAGMTCNNLGITLPTVTAPEGYTFEGWVSAVVDNEKEEPTILKAGDTFETEGDAVLYALYSYTKEEESAGGTETVYKLVTDASQLVVGKKVVIAAAGYNFALSTKQNNNNRGQAAITKNSSDNTITFGADVAVLELRAGNTISGTATYAFYSTTSSSESTKTDIGYLYAAGGTGKNNYLRTETALSDNSSFKVTVNSDKTCDVVSMGGAARNVMMYNQSSALFACYASGQKDLALYIETEVQTSGTVEVTYYTTVIGDGCAHEHAALTGVKTPSCTEEGYTGDLYCSDCQTTLVKGEDIAATAHASAEWIGELASTCKTNGTKAHYHCDICGKDFLEKTASAEAQTADDLKLPLDAQNHEGDTEIRDMEPAEIGKPGYTGDTWCLGCGEKIADGTATDPLPQPYAAQIGDVKYLTFAEAVAAVEEGQTIVMLRDARNEATPVVSKAIWFGIDSANGGFPGIAAGDGYEVSISGMGDFGYWTVAPVEVPTESTEPETTEGEETTEATEPETTEGEETTEATEPETTEAEETTEATEPETTEGEETTEATESETTEGEETTEATEPETTEGEESTEATEPTVPEETKPEEVTEITVRVQVPEGWENPTIWAWNDAGQNAFEAWPGLALTKGADGYWYATVPAWVENIIIAANGGTVQTADLDLAKTKVDVTVNLTLAADGSVTADMEYASPETGDPTALTAMAVTMLLAAAGFVTAVAGKKKFF